jgi:hypothetical protein
MYKKIWHNKIYEALLKIKSEHKILPFFEKDVEILSEELKKPWIKTSMKRAKGNDYNNETNPSNSLF